MKPKVAIVVQRYGLEVNGGAEHECRLLAELMNSDWDITVLTTCALDYMTWANHFPPGDGDVEGVRVIRFAVAQPRDIKKFNTISQKIFSRTHSADDEIKWMKSQGPDSPALTDYIQAQKDDFDLLIFFTYLYGTTFWNLPLVKDKAVMVPTAHDEPPIYLSIFENLFKDPAGFIFNSHEEKKFLVERFGIDCTHSDVVGIGLKTDLPVSGNNESNLQLPENYVIYAGRIDESKGCAELFDYWQKYKERNPGDLKLVLIGSSQMEIPNRNDIVSPGFVSEAEKYAALSHSVCLIMPSPYESLSIVLLESWLCGRCVLVNGHCDVLIGQCRRSNGGLWYLNFDEFEACLNYICSHEDEAGRMALNGKKYTQANYDWDIVKTKWNTLVQEILTAQSEASPK